MPPANASHVVAAPALVSVGGTCLHVGDTEVVLVMCLAPERKGGPVGYRFQVRPRGRPPRDGERLHEFDLTVGESEVVPRIKDRGTRFVLTVLADDVQGGTVRVVTSRAAQRLPGVFRFERDGAPQVESVMANGGPVPAEVPAAGPQTAPAPPQEAERPVTHRCPSCGDAACGGAIPPAHRKILRMGLGALAEKASRHPLEADRIAMEVGVNSTGDLLPAVLTLLGSVAGNVTF